MAHKRKKKKSQVQKDYQVYNKNKRQFILEIFRGTEIGGLPVVSIHRLTPKLGVGMDV